MANGQQDLKDRVSQRRPPFVSIALLHAVGVFLFVSGFLLTRKELKVHSSCNDPQASCPTSGILCDTAYAGPAGCSTPRTVPQYRFVLMLIVDAIRFDFIPQFKSIEKTLRDQPSKARLFDFVADAPTTTMQRLKALTTGGLPTFVDMGRSFEAGIDIQEDNWVHQAVRAGHEMRVVGDDTWVSLYPEHRVTEALPFPSLNVKDIDGCDDHVIKHFPEQLEKAAGSSVDGSSIVVGHFLGVDHIGHRFGIEHPEMRRKVQQMDQFLDQIKDWAVETSAKGKGETLLLLFGDHGQTISGDHGGATLEEVESFLFAFSSADFIDDPFHGKLPVPDQTADFAQFLGPPHTQFRDFLSGSAPVSFAGRETAPRILQSDFVPTISAALGIPIPFGNLGRITWNLLSTRGQEQDLVNVLAAHRSNALQVQHFLVEYQAQTADSLPADMVAAATRLLAAAERRFSAVREGSDADAITAAVAAYQEHLRHVAGAARQAWATFDEPRMVAGVVVLLVAAVGAAGGLVEELQGLYADRRVGGVLLAGVGGCVGLHGAGLFSNSYIVNGRGVTHFLASTILVVWAFARARVGAASAAQDVGWVGAMLVLQRCTLAYSSLVFEKGVQEAEWTAQCAVLGLLSLHAARFLRSARLHPLDLLFWAASFGCAAWYWTLQLTQQLEAASSALRLGLPRIAYALAACHAVLSLRSSRPAFAPAAAAPAPLHPSFIVLAPCACLILGAGSAVCVALAAMQVRCLWTIAGSEAAGPGQRLVREVMLCLLATQLFYSSGHRPTFEGVQYGAAFQGIDDVSANAMAHLLAGCLTVLNTYGAYILMIPACFGTSPKDGAVVHFFFSMTLALTVVFVGLTRRHLMVWAIFAPKMVYDVMIAAMVDIIFLGSMLITSAPAEPAKKAHE